MHDRHMNLALQRNGLPAPRLDGWLEELTLGCSPSNPGKIVYGAA